MDSVEEGPTFSDLDTDERGIEVLLVENEPAIADVAARFLARENGLFSVTTVGSERAALDELAADHEFECVVSDHDAPTLDALDLLEAVREDHPDLPFMLFTGRGSEAIASEAVSAGVTDYIRKEAGTEQYELLANRIEQAVEKRRSERELRESRETLANVVAEANDAIVVAQDGKLKFANPEAANILETAVEDIVGTPVPEWVVPEHREMVASRLRNRLSGEDVQRRYEFTALSAEDNRVPLEFTASVISFEGDPAVLAVCRDISRRKQRAEKLQRQAERLEELASVVNHDLRQPLEVAKGSLGLYRSRDEERQLDRVETAHERLEEIMEELVDLARTGRPVEDPERVSLTGATEAAWNAVDTGDATLVVETDATVRADESRLGRLFENCYRNAPRHGGDAPTVTVDVTPGGFYVEDDGPGVPPDQREDVFEHGYTTSKEGTGLGLTLVRRIAHAHDWTVTITDGETGGARVAFDGATTVDERT